MRKEVSEAADKIARGRLSALCRLLGVPDITYKLAKYVERTPESVFFSTKTNRKYAAKALKVSEITISKTLKAAVETGLLIKTDYGMYKACNLFASDFNIFIVSANLESLPKVEVTAIDFTNSFKTTLYVSEKNN